MMNDSYTVYRYVMPSGKCYIGITSRDVKARKHSGYNHNPFIRNAIRKYGWKNIEVEILAENVSREVAECLEIYYIRTYESDNHRKGYNIAPGGLAPAFCDETRRKLSEAAKKRHRPATESTRLKLKTLALGRCHPFYCFETNKIYLSLQHASYELGISREHISGVLRGNRKHRNGYHFIYVENLTEEIVNDYNNKPHDRRPDNTGRVKEDKAKTKGRTCEERKDGEA